MPRYVGALTNWGQFSPIEFFNGFADRWRRMSLANQFALASTIVIIIGMSAVGAWIAKRIEESVLRNSAGAAALYMDGFVAPQISELQDGQPLEKSAIEALDNIINTQLGDRIVAIKIWGAGGTIIYSSNPELTNRSFPITTRLKSAWSGNIEVEFDELGDEENVLEREFQVPLVEIYSPIRKRNTGKIIAVSEFYERADSLSRDLTSARLQTGLVVGTLTLLMALSVSGIVRRGSATIQQQQIALEGRVAQLSQLLARNKELQVRLVDAGRRAAETNESVLRRVGAELHDGPTQLVGLALLRLDAIGPTADRRNEHEENLEIIKHALHESMHEIRHLCSGLALPELETMTLADTIELAVRNHERRSQTRVELHLPADVECGAQMTLKMTVYRFIQEGLNNSFRHSGGVGQEIRAACKDGEFVIEVIDQGEGFDTASIFRKQGSLGLKGLRDRIEAVGGIFELYSENGIGTRLVARLPQHVEKSGHA